MGPAVGPLSTDVVPITAGMDPLRHFTDSRTPSKGPLSSAAGPVMTGMCPVFLRHNMVHASQTLPGPFYIFNGPSQTWHGPSLARAIFTAEEDRSVPQSPKMQQINDFVSHFSLLNWVLFQKHWPKPVSFILAAAP